MSHFDDNKDNQPDLKRDWLANNVIVINFIRISDTTFNTLDELEHHYIGLYNCVKPNGYNHQRGNTTNKCVTVYT